MSSPATDKVDKVAGKKVPGDFGGLLGHTQAFNREPVAWIETRAQAYAYGGAPAAVFNASLIGDKVVVVTSDEARRHVMESPAWQSFSHASGYAGLLGRSYPDVTLVRDRFGDGDDADAAAAAAADLTLDDKKATTTADANASSGGDAAADDRSSSSGGSGSGGDAAADDRALLSLFEPGLSRNAFAAYAPVVRAIADDHLRRWAACGSVKMYKCAKDMFMEIVLVVFLGIAPTGGGSSSSGSGSGSGGGGSSGDKGLRANAKEYAKVAALSTASFAGAASIPINSKSCECCCCFLL
jgi:uncharacterized membrane protein YgcG